MSKIKPPNSSSPLLKKSMSNLTLSVRDSGNEQFYRRLFQLVLPFNVPLCILTLPICLITLTYYWRNRGTLTNTLFLIITAADLVTWLGNVTLLVYALLLSQGMISTSGVFMGIQMTSSLMGTTTSVHLTMVLVVVRTIKISLPFYRVKVKALSIYLGIIICLIIILSIPSVWYIIFSLRSLLIRHRPWGVLWQSVMQVYVGLDLSTFLRVICNLSISFTQSNVMEKFMLVLFYLCPLSVVFTCLIAQLVITLRRARARDPEDPVVTDWTHVNITVVLLSTTFLVCNSGTAALQIYNQTGVQRNYSLNMCAWELISYTILPLLNAFLAPTIMLLRSQEMRRNVVVMIRRAFRTSAN